MVPESRSQAKARAVFDATQTNSLHLSRTIRAVVAADLSGLKVVVDGTGLFPSAMLDEMLAGYLAGEGDELWLTADENEAKAGPIAVAYAAPERMTLGTWNMYLLAVHPAHQRRGLGAALVRRIEDMLAASGQRVLIAETSGLPEFERTRAFYRTIGYDEEARIRDFYAPGEDKIVFRKALSRA